MKTPKEKAKELVKMFRGYEMTNESFATKQCALHVVDEIAKSIEPIIHLAQKSSKYKMIDLEYWQEVREEIEKL